MRVLERHDGSRLAWFDVNVSRLILCLLSQNSGILLEDKLPAGCVTNPNF